jgi:hypothetical protein
MFLLMKLMKCLLLVAGCLCPTLIKRAKKKEGKKKERRRAGASHQITALEMRCSQK